MLSRQWVGRSIQSRVVTCARCVTQLPVRAAIAGNVIVGKRTFVALLATAPFLPGVSSGVQALEAIIRHIGSTRVLYNQQQSISILYDKATHMLSVYRAYLFVDICFSP